MAKNRRINFSILLLLGLLCFPVSTSPECNCTCDHETNNGEKKKALNFKVVVIVKILVRSALGVLIPIFCRKAPFLAPASNIFLLIKAFGVGLILSTGFLQILPDAYENLTNPWLNEHPWSDFPFTGFIAMLSAITTMLIDAFATTYYKRSHFNRSSLEDGNDVKMVPPQQEAHLHVHMHATHGHMLMGLVLYHLKLSCLIYSGIGLYIRYDRSSLVSAHSVQPDAIDCLFSH